MSDKPSLRGTLQNDDPVYLKNVTVMKDKESVTNCPFLEETTVAWTLNAVWDPRLDLGQKTGISGETGKTGIGAAYLLMVLYQC